MTTYSSEQKPGLVTAIAVMTLLSGIVNIFWGLIATLTVLATLVGVVCTPFTILPTILGVFEIIFAAKLLGNPPQAVRPSPTLAAFEIACILAGNAFSLIVGILALVFYNDLMVKAWFAELNAPQPFTAPVPAAPALEAPAETPAEAPVEAAPAPAPEEIPAGSPDEPPAEPPSPRRPRKVA